jgi:hypothetical protein
MRPGEPGRLARLCHGDHKLRSPCVPLIGGAAQFSRAGCLRYDLHSLQQLPVAGRGNRRCARRDLELAEYRGDVVVDGAG